MVSNIWFSCGSRPWVSTSTVGWVMPNFATVLRTAEMVGLSLLTSSMTTCTVRAFSVVESAQTTNASAPAVPVTDTIKAADENGVVRSTPERATLFAVQTPQVFQAELLKAAQQSAITCGVNITDDCAAVERLGKQVQLVPGDGENIKITRPLDLIVAEAILKDREGRA